MSSAATTRAARIRDGKCAVCLRRNASTGHVTCKSCRHAIAEYSATRYARLRAAGRCVRCEAESAGYLCETHAEERRLRRSKS